MRWRSTIGLSPRWGGTEPAAAPARSRPLFAVLLELLLERGELGEGRVRIRLLVAPLATAATTTTLGLGEILLALGTVDTAAIAARAARTVAPPLMPLPVTAATIAILARLPILPIFSTLALGPTGTALAVTPWRLAFRRRGRL
ncbi:MAG: hypothetical protein WCA36_00550, partial [Pseudolabrys sp.]